jgi:thiamine-phosphate pyrophosphorylase
MPESSTLLDSIATAAHAGVDLIQIRERALADRALLTLVREAIAATAGTPSRVIVNDRLDIAIAAGAAGVHLPGSAFAASRARTITPPGFLIGRSVHSVDEARETERDGAADYLIFGTIYPSPSKPPAHTVAGVDRLRLVCSAVGLPVLAIGGVTVGHAPEIARAGAAGVAGIGLFSETSVIGNAVLAVRHAFDRGSELV